MNDTLITKFGTYLKSYGWEFSQHTQDELLVRFEGENSQTEFHLIIGSDENWVSMTIWPFLFPFPIEKKTDALELLCKRNFQLRLVRLGMTENGETTLCLDLPVEGLTENGFHVALDVITYYADILYPDFVTFWSKE